MGKNHKVVSKRRRRADYLKRKKLEAAARLQAAKPRKTPAKKPADEAATA